MTPMRTTTKFLSAIAMAAMAVVASATESKTFGGVTLRDGGLYNSAGRALVAASPDPVVAVTVSAGGRYIVFVRQTSGEKAKGAHDGSMWIQDRKTGKRKRVGQGLGHPCCELATEPDDASRVFGKFEQVNGALWSDSRRVLVRYVGQIHVLSMDGSLEGDV